MEKKRGQPTGLETEKGGQPANSLAYIYIYMPDASRFGPFLGSCMHVTMRDGAHM